MELYIKENELVKSGQYIGEILIGSTAEIFLPPNSIIIAKLNEKIKGGETNIAKWGKENKSMSVQISN